jgi:hypothetical protein
MSPSCRTMSSLGRTNSTVIVDEVLRSYQLVSFGDPQGGTLREWSFGTTGQSDVADRGAAFREADAA